MFPYKVIRTHRLSIGIQVKDGIIVVRAPFNISLADIEKALAEHSEWIEKRLKESERIKKESEKEPKLSMAEIRKLADEALRVIPERVAYYAEKMHVTYGKITIRNQKTRWGSCNYKGDLNFNCLLMLTPPEALDSVVVHELCHIRHHDHSKEFYQEVLKYYPDYYKWDAWLNENGKILIRRMTKE